MQTRAVIEVRVRQNDDVDAAPPRRKARAQLLHETRGIGAAVDEHRCRTELHEIRVALTDIERAHANLRIGDRPRERTGDHERGHGEQRASAARAAARGKRECRANAEMRAPADERRAARDGDQHQLRRRRRSPDLTER